MHRLVVRSLVLAAGLVTAAPGARAQGADACTDLPVTTLLAMADPEASRDAPISLLAAGTAPACRPLGIGQPPLLGSIVPPAIEVAPLEGDDLVASVAVIANPVVGVAVAAGGAAAWVAAGSGVVNSASGSTSGVVAPDAVAPNVILNPEPATLVLCASGLAALGVALRHRFRA